MADKLELSLDPNGEHIKLRWSKEDEPPSKPLRLKSEQLRVRSADVRGALNALNSYVGTNQKFEEEKTLDGDATPMSSGLCEKRARLCTTHC